MRLFTFRLCRWLALLVLALLGIYLYARLQEKPKQNDYKSLVESFVFRDEAESKGKTRLQENQMNIQVSSLLLIEDDTDDYVQLRHQDPDSEHGHLPPPRNHVITNSSHVISQFVRQRGCTLQKKHGIIYQYLKVVIICSEADEPTESGCHSWMWDPANWTLTLEKGDEVFNKYGQYRVCSYPKRSERLAKVVYANGTEEFPGCSFNRTPCTNVEPYFDKALHMRINWSPCCRRMMLIMLSNAHDIFEKYRIRYVMLGGAVISIARENGTLIPYDTDLDLMVDIRDREKFSNQSATDMAALGYYYVWDKKESYTRICQNTACDAHIDVWFYERYPGDRHMIKYFKMRFWSLREGTLFPTSWQTFEGKKYRFPRKIVKYLNHEYSSGLMAGYRNWKQVLLCNYKRGRKCTFYSEKS